MMLHRATVRIAGPAWRRLSTSPVVQGTSVVESAVGEVVVVGPDRDADVEGLVLLLHGLGDSAAGWTDGAQFLHRELPNYRFVLPTAPVQPVTLNMGMAMTSWYDLVGLESRDAELCDGIEASQKTVETLLTTEMDRAGLEPKHTVLAGFSQGGALSLFTALQWPHDEPLAGALCMSGYLPKPSGLADRLTEAGKAIPIQLLHGAVDQMVRHEHAEATLKALEAAGLSVELKSYPGLAHGANVEELNDAIACLRGWIGGEKG